MNELYYVYTTFGSVFSGLHIPILERRDIFSLIPLRKLQEYNERSSGLDYDLELELIRELGWVIPKSVIKKTERYPLNETPQGKRKVVNRQPQKYFNRSILFVIGAGASYSGVLNLMRDQFESDWLRPPLGNELFQVRFKSIYSKYPGVKKSVHELSIDDVEATLEQNWEDIAENGNRELLSRNIDAQFYLQNLLQEVSSHFRENYLNLSLWAKMVDFLQRKSKISIDNGIGERDFPIFNFVSFNQDYILDDALSEYFQKPIMEMDDYLENYGGGFQLFKPHGSCNWGWPITKELNSEKLSDFIWRQRMDLFDVYDQLLGGIKNSIDWNSYGYNRLDNSRNKGYFTIDKDNIHVINNKELNTHFPALLLPYRDKDEVIMPNVHSEEMNRAISHCRTLVIIGWKGNESVFNKRLIMHGRNISKIIIANRTGESIRENLKELIDLRKPEIIHYLGFEKFVHEGLTELFGEN